MLSNEVLNILIEKSATQYLAKSIRCIEQIQNAKETIKVVATMLCDNERYHIAKVKVDDKIKFSIPLQILTSVCDLIETKDNVEIEIEKLDLEANVELVFNSEEKIIQDFVNNKIDVTDWKYDYTPSKKLGIKMLDLETKVYRAISYYSFLRKIKEDKRVVIKCKNFTD